MTDNINEQLDELWYGFRDKIRAVTADSHRKGLAWESEFREEAIRRGLHVASGTCRDDMVVAGRSVQCKHIDQTDGASVPIDNMRQVFKNNGRRGYMAGEYDVLALKHRGTVYIIDSERLVSGDKMISRLPLSAFADAINGWGVFDPDYLPPDPHQPNLIDLQ